MKLQNKKDKNKKILLIAGIAIAVIVVILLAILLLTPSNGVISGKQDTDIIRIVMSNYPTKSTYYIGEEFDPTGASIQVLTHNSDYTHFVDCDQLTFSGFDSTVANDAVVITVSYKGFTTTFNVKVQEKPSETPVLTDIEIVGFKTTYTMTEWNAKGPNVDGATVNLIYSDGSVDNTTNLQKKWIYGAVQISEPCTLDLTIKYNNNGQVFEKVVTITITN